MSALARIANFLVPQESNNYKAKILHNQSLSVIASIFLIFQFVLSSILIIRPNILGYASQISPEKVIELTNKEREKIGASPLVINSALNEAAQRKAGDMFAFNYWAHTSPSGRSPWAFFQEVGYRYLFAGENLARDFMDSEAVVQAWINSPSHRDNILNPHYKDIGLAVVNGTLKGAETTLVVQLFATPAVKTTAQKPAEKKILTKAPSLGEATAVEEKMSPVVSLSEARGETINQPLFSPFTITKTISMFLLGIILGALSLDAILVYQRRIIRLSGRNIAHLIFLGALLLVIIFTSPGAIL